MEGLEEPLFARVRESQVKQSGSDVGVMVNREDILVFSASTGDKPDA